MPAAMARARMTAIFFMAISPLLLVWRLPDRRNDFRDRHHVLELLSLRLKQQSRQRVPTASGFAFVPPTCAVFSDGIRSVVGPAGKRVRLAFTCVLILPFKERDAVVRGEDNKSRATVLKRSLRLIPCRYRNTPDFAVRLRRARRPPSRPARRLAAGALMLLRRIWGF
jgi:hypothetical protein